MLIVLQSGKCVRTCSFIIAQISDELIVPLNESGIKITFFIFYLKADILLK